jgi:hypothetical protein
MGYWLHWNFPVEFNGCLITCAVLGGVGFRSALVHLPVSFAVIAKVQQAIFGVVSLAAYRTDQIAAPRRALPVIILSNRECRAATAGNQQHA